MDEQTICPHCKEPIGKPHQWSPTGDHIDGFDRIECEIRKACNALEEKKDWEALAKKEREYSSEVKKHSNYHRKDKGHWKAQSDELRSKVRLISEKLVEASVITKVFSGVKYMRIPDGVKIYTTHDFGEDDLRCDTAWFRMGLDKSILKGEFPKDFIRCPGCNGTKFGFESGIDWGATYCKSKKCGKSYHDLEYGYMEYLFPDKNVLAAVNAHYGKFRKES